MPALRTPLQRQIMGWCKVLTQRKVKAGQEPKITTKELTSVTSRYGQVLGHSCGSLADRGLLTRTGPATYSLTREGLAAIKQEGVTAYELFVL